MIMSSDKLASIKEPVVALDFDVVESGEDRNVSVELTKEELNSLISSLEAANKVNIQHLMVPRETINLVSCVSQWDLRETKSAGFPRNQWYSLEEAHESAFWRMLGKNYM